MFQKEANLKFEFYVQQSCPDRKSLSLLLTPFLNPFSKFREKLKITILTIEMYGKCIGKIFQLNFSK